MPGDLPVLVYGLMRGVSLGQLYCCARSFEVMPVPLRTQSCVHLDVTSDGMLSFGNLLI
jgi:hypothetical protein